MKTIIEITNENLFNEKVIDVDTSGMIGLRGTLSIETEEKGWFDITGEFGQYDYEDEFGFILKIV